MNLIYLEIVLTLRISGPAKVGIHAPRRRSRTRVASRMRRQRVPLVLARAPGVYCIKIGLPGKLILEYTGNRLVHVVPFQDQNMY